MCAAGKIYCKFRLSRPVKEHIFLREPAVKEYFASPDTPVNVNIQSESFFYDLEVKLTAATKKLKKCVSRPHLH